jgi:peroxiredoxin
MVSTIRKLGFAVFSTVFSISSINAQVPNKAEDISPLLIGEALPKASLQNSKGDFIELRNILTEKPSVIVFYRGGWCPYCSAQLSGLAEIEKDILNLGFKIIAISPDDYKNLSVTGDKVNYGLYSDPEGKFIKEVGIAFQTPTMTKTYIATKGQKGETSEVIPVPTVMVVNQKGTILFEYINPNYKERISGEMLLAVLKTIKIED